MVNFNLNLASIVGIALVIGGAALYAVRTVRPELARDYDIFFCCRCAFERRNLLLSRLAL